MGSLESNKAKIAKRVIEVLEYFDDSHPSATVMDIVRRYDRPQSSTSELLSSMVDLGLLYKDATSRSYTLTPRAAMLGNVAQPEIVRDGRLTAILDRLVAQTGLSVALFGLIGLNAQVFNWRSGNRALQNATVRAFGGGKQSPITSSSVGHLLLSTIPQPRRDGVIRRLNAEAPEAQKFAFADMAAEVHSIQAQEYAIGPAGFGSSATLCAILLPGQKEGHPMAIGFIYEPTDQIDPLTLVHCLREAVSRGPALAIAEPMQVEPIYSAA
jgi:DNA-binding IclR family transcriptional regulator